MSDLNRYERDKLQEFLAPEWEQARAEVADHMNCGWMMVAIRAIKIRSRTPSVGAEVAGYRSEVEDLRRENRALALRTGGGTNAARKVSRRERPLNAGGLQIAALLLMIVSGFLMAYNMGRQRGLNDALRIIEGLRDKYLAKRRKLWEDKKMS